MWKRKITFLKPTGMHHAPSYKAMNMNTKCCLMYNTLDVFFSMKKYSVDSYHNTSYKFVFYQWYVQCFTSYEHAV